MTVTLNLPPDIEEAFRAEAHARGLSIDELVRVLLLALRPSTDIGMQFSGELSPEEWVRQFKTWTRSHAGDDLPVLSDEAMSREFIYRERGL